MRYFSLSILLVSLCSCHRLNQGFGLQDNNPIEQSIEKEIEDLTGSEVDLTPNSSH